MSTIEDDIDGSSPALVRFGLHPTRKGLASAHAAVQVLRATSLSDNLNGKLFLARPLTHRCIGGNEQQC
ncbi:hypothetical protein K0M31_010893 [Melipona bicolor]|uniref:Uncharacterized protein n=1 Tax=Melipona bicolor TaxID=60889 RepID=A0AA40FL22_9HYME|nr:hypothetical protein K0M31_010893 [Melipona bicolor]